jgi:hypothetical protein
LNFSFSSRRFWARLGNHRALGVRLLAIAIAFIAMLSFAFDVVRLGNFTWLWLPANALGILVSLALTLPAIVMKRRVNTTQAQQPWFNIIVASLFFGFKNLSMLYISPMLGIADEGVPAFRFIGGLLLGATLLVLYTNVSGNRLQRQTNLAKLQEIEGELLSFREAALEELEDENREAALKAFKVLAPQLEDLQFAVKQSRDIVTLVNKVINFIRVDLRPFNEDLVAEAKNLSRPNSRNTTAPGEPETMVNLSKSLRIWNSFVPLPLLFFLTAIFAVPNATLLDILGMCLVFIGTLLLFKLVTRNLPNLSIPNAFIAITLVAFFTGIPAFFVLNQIPNESGVPELLPSFIVMQGWSVIAASQAHILDLSQSRIEVELNKAIIELARENKIYEQKAWLARHGWYLLLHGVVQPALTSASIRASNPEMMASGGTKDILNDLQRALDALRNSRSVIQPVDVSIAEIKSVWNGICEVDLSITPPASYALKNNEIASQILNEILKEVVSNAVRHGSANIIIGNISMRDSRTIDILIANDGLKPTNQTIDSVGSKMLDAVCLERTLEWNDDQRKTEFKAVIPIKN